MEEKIEEGDVLMFPRSLLIRTSVLEKNQCGLLIL